ncbi:MAG TPA: phosphoadenosine phosphosulfate reductase family protein [Gammaproteobacteria bacterium]|nr:phosphoadenosine phosphosulfate reductase family protein [Gammaproteobacteria bacterium]
MTEEFGHDVILTTSFGPTAGVMLKLVTDVMPNMRVITVTHGHETERTRELMGIYSRMLKLNLKVYQAPQLPIPAADSAEFVHFTRVVKFEPLQAALKLEAPKVWLSGVMREESSDRRFFPYARTRGRILAVYPVLDWTPMQAIDFCLSHKLPMNEDYYDPSKGPKQDQECGIHTRAFED